MNVAPLQKQDFWLFLHDLIFNIPAPVLSVVEYAVALLVVVGFIGCAARIWRGDRFEFGPVRIERAKIVDDLQTALRDMSRDDKLKGNVLWLVRDRLNEAKRIVRDGVDDGAVKSWCGEVLVDVATAMSRGGHDRHRASLWICGAGGLRMYNGNGFRQEAVERATLPLESIAGNVFVTGTSYNSIAVDADRAFFPKPRSGRAYQSLLSVPVKACSGKTIAILCVDAEARGYFDRDDEFFAGCFADLIALLVAQIIVENGTPHEPSCNRNGESVCEVAG